MKKINIKKLHIGIILIGIIFVSLGIFHSNLWFDEAYSCGIAKHSFSEIWNIGGHDVHPVLYYWMLHIIGTFTNNSILSFRIFSAIAIIILGILGYTHIRKDFGEKTGLLFSFLIYFSPITAVYANEIRMYAWAMLFVTLLAIYAYRLAHKSKKSYWIIFGITSLCSIYIHYYGLMAAGLINIVLLIYYIRKCVILKKEHKNEKLINCTEFKSLMIQIGIGVVQVILYLPWFIYFLSQLNTMSTNGFWINIEFPKTYIEILGFSFAGNLNIYIGFAISIFVYAYVIYLIKKNGAKESKPALYALEIYIMVILAALIMTKILGTDILYYRYIIVVTGLSFFAICYNISKGNNIITIIFCIITLITGIISNCIMIKDNYDLSNMKQVEYLKENIQEGDVIVYTNIGNGSVFAVNFPDNKQYFYNPANWQVNEAYKAWGPHMGTYITNDFLSDEECQGRIWIITSENPSCYNKYFKNENYKLISQEKFDTTYQDYKYQVILVEKVK